jgi:two-component system phosphate regulon sensor histidine kinase PhoR
MPVPAHLLSLAANLLLAALCALAAFAWWRGRRRRQAIEQRQTEFVAAVSHEFRSPITTIRHLTELLAQDRLPSLEMQRRCLTHIAQETERLNTLVEDLLDFGRIESRRKTYHREPADIALLVRQAVDDFRQDPESVAHFWNTERVTPGLWSVVDGGALRRALRNLLENAVKYSPAGRTIFVSLHRAGDELRIAVRDEGEGIPKQEQHAVFEKFVRGRAALEARIKGTGIGLALVKSIAEAHGGRVTLESEPGRGSTFSITIPLERH